MRTNFTFAKPDNSSPCLPMIKQGLLAFTEKPAKITGMPFPASMHTINFQHRTQGNEGLYGEHDKTDRLNKSQKVQHSMGHTKISQ